MYYIILMASVMRKGTFRHKQKYRSRPATMSPQRPIRGLHFYDTRHTNGTYISCCVYSLITYTRYVFSTSYSSWSGSTLCVMSKGPFSCDVRRMWCIQWLSNCWKLHTLKVMSNCIDLPTLVCWNACILLDGNFL